MSWEVYIIETQKGRLYTGIAKSSLKRFEEHKNDPRRRAKFFRSDSPKKIVFQELHSTRSLALKREYQIKQMSRLQKLRLISGNECVG